MADTAGTPQENAASSVGEVPDSSSRKRKADHISVDLHDDDAENSADVPPHLPAPIWGRVLDFMPYAEVRSALLVGKLIAVEAVKYVQTLNIMKGCEMFIPAARRFTNVEEVNILCFLEFEEDEDDNDDGDVFSISLDVCNRTVPFLGGFSKLTHGFIGGLDSDGDRRTFEHTYHFDQDQDEYRNLLSAYVGAIKTGVLSEGITLEGMELRSLSDYFCREVSSNCQWCRDILSHFPLDQVLRYLASVYRDNMFCQREQEAWDIVRRRPGIDKVFSKVSEGVLCERIKTQYLYVKRVKDQFRADAVEGLPEKWRQAERQCVNLHVCSLSQSDFLMLDKLIEKGFNPKYVTRKFALEKWRYNIGPVGPRNFLFCTWTRSTVELLAARGFPVDCDCIPVIDDWYIDDKYSNM